MGLECILNLMNIALLLANGKQIFESACLLYGTVRISLIPVDNHWQAGKVKK